MTAEPIIHVIPAEAGYRLVFLDHDNHVGEAIVAWRIESLTEKDGRVSNVYPLSAEGDQPEAFAILRPDGAVETPYATLPSLGATRQYLAHVRSRAGA